MTPDPWPWPTDTALTRARRVALSYRAVLEDADPTACHLIDAQMRHYGIRWVVPTIATYADDDWLSAEQVATHADVNLATVYTWRKRGLRSITTNEGIRFQYTDVAAWQRGNK